MRPPFDYTLAIGPYYNLALAIELRETFLETEEVATAGISILATLA